MTVDTLAPRRLWHIAALCLAVALLAACAGRPDFATLDTRVVPAAPLEAGDDAALRVALESLDADGARGELIAETTSSRVSDAPMDISLQFDGRALDAERDYALIAEIREGGRVTHRNSEQVTLTGAQIGQQRIEIPLAPR
ncbi:YbaY family lipoprotein [Franzmannia qiaohouensis]|uniref:YbaY family lipoprotein n=1 Tax=Franzmannia qiaohouensis TaxID=1329370 RepID=A0ABU1HJ85_9GAMM|nr:YbaY family lipoprotein [Halomonas qiaohouensis]MDR5907552.1 YbaY family lipoprotein [Halomonas qiaohouensis]